VPATVHVFATIGLRWLDEHNVCARRRSVCGISWPYPSSGIDVG
jgi:hypothetical protein